MKRKNAKKRGITLPKHLEHLNRYTAGIDIGSRSHFVAVPEGTDEKPVREFSTFTGDLERLADWLIACGVTTVAMESTGVYWIPVFELLEARGLEVKLVNARHVKNVPGRKSDVLDCQWLQQLHTYGLLQGAFRPADEVCTLRAYVRQRSTLVRSAASYIQRMQKALAQMNLQLHHAVTDITGTTGMRIIKAILGGERNPDTLASMRDPRCRNSQATLARALKGTYRPEHLFSLQQAVELYQFYQTKIADCDRQILDQLTSFDESPADVPPPTVGDALLRMSGVDLTCIDGIDTTTALKVLAEIGTDMSRWKSSKHFASWLGLSPGTKVSGGKVLSSATKPVANKAAQALRMAAFTLFNSKSALGAYLRRQRARLGAPKAITATAHKLARLIYAMLTHGRAYVDAGQEYYEERYRSRVIQNLKRKAQELGYELVTMQKTATA
ncbi:MAG: Transposase IS116/IS110/IS902 family protein [Syntrophorhabdus sp. PtaU1.Bin153]|nr:MAG: Transposase IS116/IS110/IS902 family protein [Syntrophorhabdus sp. PtaU1.Bin153]